MSFAGEGGSEIQGREELELIRPDYSNIFSLITRMRQMACHPDLVLRSKTAMLKDMESTAEGTVCRLCQDTVSLLCSGDAIVKSKLTHQAEDAIVSACRHVFDRECIRQYLEVQQMRGHRVRPIS